MKISLQSLTTSGAGKKMLITGGLGFLGSAWVKRAIKLGYDVVVFDDASRGNLDNLADVAGKYSLISGDIRNPKEVEKACEGVESVWHFAFINGTEFFYSMPDKVLEVGVKGMINIIDACQKNRVKELFVASSSEVYHQPAQIPTPEDVPLIIPDPHNPRYSYAGGKLISELLSLHLPPSQIERTVIFRPHNIYGPQMGYEHVIPQFILRLKELSEKSPKKNSPLDFPIRGDGKQTRAFCYVDDFVDGLEVLLRFGKNREIYHLGKEEEISMEMLAMEVAKQMDLEIRCVPQDLPLGETLRRCPTVQKAAQIGYQPSVSLDEGLRKTMKWYLKNPKKLSRRDELDVEKKASMPKLR